MVDIEEIIINGERVIFLGGLPCKRKENLIGVRKKFWLMRQNVNRRLREKPRTTDFLFKYNRNDLSSEDIGEVICSSFFALCGAKVVNYYTATYTDLFGKKHKGVVCGSYRKNNNEVETSGYYLQKVLTPLEYNKVTGETNKPINTVYGFLDDLSTLLDGVENKDKFLTDIKNDLNKQCLLDFLLAQTDRHWLNTTFLESFEDSKYKIRKSPCYDNGCIANLKRKRQAITTFASMINKDYVNAPVMKDIMKNYCPMFGVKTSTVVIDVDRAKKVGNVEKLKVISDPNIKQNFLKELAIEVLTDVELTCFYIKLRDNILAYNKKDKTIKTDKLFDFMNASGEDVSDDIKEMVKAVLAYQINELEIELNKQLVVIRQAAEMGE